METNYFNSLISKDEQSATKQTTAQQKGNVEVDGGRLLILNRQTFQNDLAVSRRCPLA